MVMPEATPDKTALRTAAEERRRRQRGKDRLSAAVCARFAALAPYAAAATVMAYVGVRNEVRTLPLLTAMLIEGKQLVVPFCAEGELRLFRLYDLDELRPGHFGIPEPSPALRRLAQRRADPRSIDLVMVPGVAFDRRGGRIGQGRGYYDRFLARLREDAFTAGLAFECQLFPAVPMEPHDVFLDAVVTEERLYSGRGRRG